MGSAKNLANVVMDVFPYEPEAEAQKVENQSGTGNSNSHWWKLAGEKLDRLAPGLLIALASERKALRPRAQRRETNREESSRTSEPSSTVPTQEEERPENDSHPPDDAAPTT